MKSRKQSSKKMLLATGLSISLLAILYFAFFMGSSNDAQQLEGTWLRSDGTYKIEITDVQPEGKLLASYFNPASINVGRSGWRLQNEDLQFFVELQDKNYQGSFYQLTFDKNTETLIGTYYQALSKQTYEVSFNKVK